MRDQGSSLIQERINSWLEGPYDPLTKDEIRRLQREDPGALEAAFYCDLSFGTGGLRSLMGIGTNRMNVYTVRMVSQGLAEELLRQGATGPVFVGYDVRINSRLFAEETARTLAGNGIIVYLTKEVCPTPLVSFGCRYFRCAAAVMITASHNPPEYNGYKVYWSDGAQVVPPNDQRIVDRVKQVKTLDQVKQVALDDEKIKHVGDEIDLAYLRELDLLTLSPPKVSVDVVYSNLHGTGLRLVPKALQRRGYSDVQLVEAQKALEGAFPNAPIPNPEEGAAFTLGMEQLLREQADLLLVTDPDADRIGVAVRHQGRGVRFNGHEIACLLLWHIATTASLGPKSAFVKTIVTTELAAKIAEECGLRCFNVLTGFKNIARLIAEWDETQQQEFLFGAEESQGYLFKSFVRDKDAISAACLVAEMVERAKQEGVTLVDRLHAIYQQYGLYRQRLASLSFEDTPANREKIVQGMALLRKSPPERIARWHVERVEDYLKRVQDRSDMLLFWLEGNGKVVVRPSGTEPKIKFYFELREGSGNGKGMDQRIAECDRDLRVLERAFMEKLGKGTPSL